MTNLPPPTRSELARLRAEVAELQAELDLTRHELNVLQARRATRAGEALRQGRSKGAVKGAMAAVGELRRPSIAPDKPESITEGPVLASRLRAARRLRDAGELDAALDEARVISLDHPEDPEVLDLLVALLLALGSPAQALEMAQRLARIDDSPRLRARRRRIAGTLRGLDPRFHPDPGPLGASERTGPVLVLVPERPEPEAEPSVIEDRRRIETFLTVFTGEVTSEVLTVNQRLTAHYPKTGPLDSVLTDVATSLAPSVDDLQPRAIVAVITDPAPSPAIVARSLARAAQVPLVVVRPCRGSQGSEVTRLSRAAGDTIAEAAHGSVGADAGITPTQAAQVSAELLAHLTAPGSA